MDEDVRCRMLLDLPERYSDDQLRQAYRDMVKVWHPDRFAHDDRLRQIAQDKLKEINGAYEYLRAKLFDDSITSHASAGSQSPVDNDDGSRPKGSAITTVSIVLGIALLASGLGFYVYKVRNMAASTKQGAVSAKQASTVSDNTVILLDGKTMEHWRGFRQPNFPDQSWDCRDGILRTVDGAPPVDLMTQEEYQDFDLSLEWRISPGGNSGIMYHVSEAMEAPWKSGMEMQLLDDDLNADGRKDKTSAGSLFGVIAPTNKHLNPVGEWNQARIVVNGHHVEHWLNGAKVVEYELESEAMNAAIADSQFRDEQGYARQKTGHILLQSYERQVAFRNIKIRRLTPPRAPGEP